MATFLMALLSLCVLGCNLEPERACNRVRFAWPLLTLDARSDMSTADGIQVQFTVSSDLDADVEATLFVRVGESEERAVAGVTTSDEEGSLSFQNATLPTGDVTLIIEAKDFCGLHKSGRRTFVWDGNGKPRCELSLGLPPSIPTIGAIPLLTPLNDEDPTVPGMQTLVRINAGRSDMEVSLFVRDRGRSQDQDFGGVSGVDGSREFMVTLEDGEQALRAVCYWPEQELRTSSATHVFEVVSGPPSYANFGQGFMAKYCTGCHSPSATTRFFPYLDTLARVRALSIRVDLRAGRGMSMPPFDPRLTASERTTLSEWIAAGLP